MAKKKRVIKKKIEIKSQESFNRFRKEMAFGIIFGFLVFFFTLFDKLIYNIPQIVGIFLDLYGKCGYDLTYLGSVLGLAYGFITGYLLMAVYNWLYRRV
jgi:hypothetical protein